MNAIDKLNLLRSGKLTVTQNVKSFLDKIKKENPKINAFIDVRPELALNDAEYLDKNREKLKNKKLFGLCIGVKAAINVKNYNISCASNTLKNYIAPYDATVIKKIKDEGGIIIGITNCDEFCCGISGEKSAFGVSKNPSAIDRIPGGSSSGSAAAVAAGFCDIALGSDTGGSIRNPASHCGVVGVKPSYGLVSRYGLIDLSMSLDQIGVISKSVSDALLVLNVIKGRDERDATSYESKEIKLEKLSKIKIGIPKISVRDERILELINKKVREVCEANNWKQEEVELKHINLGIQTYYPIVYVEFFSGTRKFDGRRFGKKIEDSCGEEVLRRILGGSEISKAEFKGTYYRRALKAKEIIKKEFASAFEKVDCIVIPTVPKLPHKFGEKLSVEEEYDYDVCTVLANLAEIPAISVPAGKIDQVPVGLQILTRRFDEGKMLSIAEKFE
ncbi:MAG: Asp-tRNA(Asn)/Glu-tRNA(Gln) amidotransferase subunit GatA [Nanoarchaeota archaeon]|nr:Asp-tRNA(Asn)/Glu-tRNA(Gln) amidotransferase subunit GatA [Nanoarchaeota archaeon]MBU4086759.1 Asp-tRNA(Asn)/Glu-tRNA(Gln) amidotransferase subunit GatA [Nanoarchaeota archaeon]